MIAQAEEAARREATLPARAILRQINGAAARREPVMSAAQRLELLRRLLPGITAVEVSRAFAATFDPTHVTFIAELPSGGDVPGEAALIALGRTAVNVTPERDTEVARAASLLASLPQGGKVVESLEHTPSGVWSAWLDNGVRVHHRFMGERKNQASVVITLAGGQIQETAATRGITDAAALAWSRPATGKLSSVQIRDLMTGTKARVGGRTDPDALTLTVSADPADLEIGLQLAHLLLTDPVIEPAALEQWSEAQRQAIAARKVEPRGVLAEAVARALYPHDEPRTRPLEAEQVQKITLDAAQAWLRALIQEAPVEVAVVGDIDRAAALALVERYLGSLPPRDRISDKTLLNLRSIKRAVGPIRVDQKINVRTQQAVVMDGFFGTDVRNVRDVRLLALAARLLSTRMNRIVREEKQLVYSIGASSQPASEYPGFGLFVARAPTDPAKAAALATVLDELYAAFAKDGPAEDEMTVAKKQMANLLDQTLREPDFWTGRLATLDYRGLSLSDVVEAPAAYQRYTAQDVRDAFARYYRPESRFRFVVTP
jgi:zinc protease